MVMQSQNRIKRGGFKFSGPGPAGLNLLATQSGRHSLRGFVRQFLLAYFQLLAITHEPEFEPTRSHPSDTRRRVV